MNELLGLVRQTLTNPQAAAHVLNDVRLNRATLWSAFFAVVCVSVLLFFVAAQFVPVPQGHPVENLSPFVLAMVLAAVLVMMVFAFNLAGRMLGGTGHFASALLLMVWLQIMAFALQLLQLIVFFIFPPLLTVVSFASMIFLIVAMLQFVRVLHGFSNILMAVLTVAIGVIGVIFGLAIVASVFSMTGEGL